MRFAAAKAYKSLENYRTVHGKRWKLMVSSWIKMKETLSKQIHSSNIIELNPKLSSILIQLLFRLTQFHTVNFTATLFAIQILATGNVSRAIVYTLVACKQASSKSHQNRNARAKIWINVNKFFTPFFSITRADSEPMWTAMAYRSCLFMSAEKFDSNQTDCMSWRLRKSFCRA